MTRTMKTSVIKRGRTSIPAAIRRRHGIREGDHLAWLDDGESIRVIHLPPDPIASLRGSGRGEQLGERLLRSRKA